MTTSAIHEPTEEKLSMGISSQEDTTSSQANHHGKGLTRRDFLRGAVVGVGAMMALGPMALRASRDLDTATEAIMDSPNLKPPSADALNKLLQEYGGDSESIALLEIQGLRTITNKDGDYLILAPDGTLVFDSRWYTGQGRPIRETLELRNSSYGPYLDIETYNRNPKNKKASRLDHLLLFPMERNGTNLMATLPIQSTFPGMVPDGLTFGKDGPAVLTTKSGGFSPTIDYGIHVNNAYGSLTVISEQVELHPTDGMSSMAWKAYARANNYIGNKPNFTLTTRTPRVSDVTHIGGGNAVALVQYGITAQWGRPDENLGADLTNGFLTIWGNGKPRNIPIPNELSVNGEPYYVIRRQFLPHGLDGMIVNQDTAVVALTIEGANGNTKIFFLSLNPYDGETAIRGLPDGYSLAQDTFADPLESRISCVVIENVVRERDGNVGDLVISAVELEDPKKPEIEFTEIEFRPYEKKQ